MTEPRTDRFTYDDPDDIEVGVYVPLDPDDETAPPELDEDAEEEPQL